MLQKFMSPEHASAWKRKVKVTPCVRLVALHNGGGLQVPGECYPLFINCDKYTGRCSVLI